MEILLWREILDPYVLAVDELTVKLTISLMNIETQESTLQLSR